MHIGHTFGASFVLQFFASHFPGLPCALISKSPLQKSQICRIFVGLMSKNWKNTLRLLVLKCFNLCKTSFFMRLVKTLSQNLGQILPFYTGTEFPKFLRCDDSAPTTFAQHAAATSSPRITTLSNSPT
jgi:hypothetical protein